jgi:hypothetical protein
MLFLHEVSNSLEVRINVTSNLGGSASALVEVFQMFQTILHVQASGRIRGW